MTLLCYTSTKASEVPLLNLAEMLNLSGQAVRRILRGEVLDPPPPGHSARSRAEPGRGGRRCPGFAAGCAARPARRTSPHRGRRRPVAYCAAPDADHVWATPGGGFRPDGRTAAVPGEEPATR